MDALSISISAWEIFKRIFSILKSKNTLKICSYRPFFNDFFLNHSILLYFTHILHSYYTINIGTSYNLKMLT